MTTDEIDLLHEKAKTRKDGIYSYRGYLWVVKDNNFIAFSTYFGDCYQRMGFFNAPIATVERYYRKEFLTKWLKYQ